MVWSGSAPRSGVRERMWGVLLVMGVAWLGVSWLVLRAEPADVADVAGPVLLFAAASEVVRALAGARTWWLGAALAVLFAAAGVVVWRGVDSSYATTAAIVGGFLMVRGVADVIVATLLRETDRIWGFVLVLGLAEAALGVWTAFPAVRSAGTLIAVLAALAVARAVADLVGALQLWEGPRASLLQLSPERADGVAGFAAGLSAYPAATAQQPPRHRAVAGGSAAALSALSAPGGPGLAGLELAEPGADLTGAGWAAGPAGVTPSGAGPTGAGPTGAGAPGAWSAGAAGAGAGSTSMGPAGAGPSSVGPPGTGAIGTAPVAAGPPGAGPAGGTPGGDRPTSFHDEVLRTTADLDTMLAMAGVTGSATGVAAAAQQVELPPVPDTPEGVLAMPGGQPPAGQWPSGAHQAEPLPPDQSAPDAAWQRPPETPAALDAAWQPPPEAAWPLPSPAVQASAHAPAAQASTAQAPNVQAATAQAPNVQAATAQAPNVQAATAQAPIVQAATAQAPIVQAATAQAPHGQAPNAQGSTAQAPAAPANHPWPGAAQGPAATGTGDGTTGGGRRRAE
ncbi:hypothetical protein [Krasilnikovia sp. MM14-A1004]|uniref:hypothetical protein n=1 Tax=Krasilnikovia sp. MM14-A1004 TaxID=3373541 RepID=UPI00399C81BD